MTDGSTLQEEQQTAVAKILEGQCETIKGADDGEKGLSEFGKPHLVLASPAGIETTSAQSTHIASDEHTALTTGRSLSFVAGDSLLASIGESFRLFVRKAGMKLIAASGKVSIRAKDDDIEAVAKKVLSLISESDWVDIRGRKGIRLHGANSMVEISEKVQFFTAAPTLFHGNLETLSPSNRPQPAEEQSSAPQSGELHANVQGHGFGSRYANVAYELYKANAKVKDGLTDSFGRIVIPHQEGTPNYKVVLGNDEAFNFNVTPRFVDEQGTTRHEQTRSNAGSRALDGTTDGRRHD